MKKLTQLMSIGMLAIAGLGYAGSVAAADRFEVASIKAVRPTLVNTAAALKKGGRPGAKAAFET